MCAMHVSRVMSTSRPPSSARPSLHCPASAWAYRTRCGLARPHRLRGCCGRRAPCAAAGALGPARTSGASSPSAFSRAARDDIPPACLVHLDAPWAGDRRVTRALRCPGPVKPRCGPRLDRRGNLFAELYDVQVLHPVPACLELAKCTRFLRARCVGGRGRRESVFVA